MPKVCKNGSTCEFMKMPKGCKFIHLDQSLIGAQVRSEIVSALKQANCSDTSMIGARMTDDFLDFFTTEQLHALLMKPVEFAEHMVMALEVYETNDCRRYVSV